MAEQPGIRGGRIYWDIDADRSSVTEFLNDIKRLGQQARTAVNSAGLDDAIEKSGGAAKRTKGEMTELQKQVLHYRNASLALRNEIEAGVITQEEGRETAVRLRKEIIEAAKGTERWSKEQRDLLVAAGRMSRTVDTLDGKVTKLGISQQFQVGLTNTMREGLLRIGPAGAAGAVGLAALERAGNLLSPTFGKKLPAAFTNVIGLMTKIQVLAPLVLGGLLFGLSRLANRAAEVADEIDKSSQAAGLSVESYQELRFVFDQNGLSAQQFEQAMSTLNRRIGETSQGVGEGAKFFDALGIEVRDATGAVRDTEDVFDEAIEKLSGLGSAAEQAAFTGRLFGEEAGRKMAPLIRQGADAVEELRRQARELGLILSGDAVISLVGYKDEMAALRQQFQTAGVEIMASLIPIFRDYLIPLLQNTVVPWIQNVAQRTGEFAERMFDAGEEGIALRGSIADILVPLITLGKYMTSLGQLAVGLVVTLSSPFATLGSILGTLSVQFDDFLEVYRKALRGDFSGFAKSPAEILFPGDSIAQAFAAGLEQAQQGLTTLMAGGRTFVEAFDTGALRQGIVDSLTDGISDALATPTRALNLTPLDPLTPEGTTGPGGTGRQGRAPNVGLSVRQAAQMERWSDEAWRIAFTRGAELATGATDLLIDPLGMALEEAAPQAMQAWLDGMITHAESRQVWLTEQMVDRFSLVGREVGTQVGVGTALGVRDGVNEALRGSPLFVLDPVELQEHLVATLAMVERFSYQGGTTAGEVYGEGFGEGVGFGILESVRQTRLAVARWEREAIRDRFDESGSEAGREFSDNFVGNSIDGILQDEATYAELHESFARFGTAGGTAYGESWQEAVAAKIAEAAEGFDFDVFQGFLLREAMGGASPGFSVTPQPEELTPRQERQRERSDFVEQITTVTDEDGAIAAFGKSLLNLAVEEVPLLGSAIQGFVSAGPIGAVTAVFVELLSSAQPFVDFIGQITEALAPIAEILGKVLQPVLEATAWWIKMVVNAFIAVYNFLLGWLFGRVDPIGTGGSAADRPRDTGGAFGTQEPTGEPPAIALTSGGTSPSAGVPTVWLDSIAMFGGHVDRFGGHVDRFGSYMQNTGGGTSARAAKYAGA